MDSSSFGPIVEPRGAFKDSTRVQVIRHGARQASKVMADFKQGKILLGRGKNGPPRADHLTKCDGSPDQDTTQGRNMFSNTVSTTVFDTRKVIDFAVKQCKLQARADPARDHRDGERRTVHLMLSALKNMNIRWRAIEEAHLRHRRGQPEPRHQHRHRRRAGGHHALPAAGHRHQHRHGQEPHHRLRHPDDGDDGRRALGRTIQTADAGAIRPQLRLHVPRHLSGGQPSPRWESGLGTDIADPISALFFLVQTVDLSPFVFLEIRTGNMPSEIPLARLNCDDYTNLPNKFFPSRSSLCNAGSSGRCSSQIMRLLYCEKCLRHPPADRRLGQAADHGRRVHDAGNSRCRSGGAMPSWQASRRASAHEGRGPTRAKPDRASCGRPGGDDPDLAQGEERDQRQDADGSRIGCYQA